MFLTFQGSTLSRAIMWGLYINILRQCAITVLKNGYFVSPYLQETGSAIEGFRAKTRALYQYIFMPTDSNII